RRRARTKSRGSCAVASRRSSSNKEYPFRASSASNLPAFLIPCRKRRSRILQISPGGFAMSQITYDEVNLMLRLYDLRRESRLRQARAWFTDNFHPTSPEEMMEKYPQGSEENTYIRMVISYWEMVASIVNRGLINDELFFESNGEIWVVWDRMRGIVPT